MKKLLPLLFTILIFGCNTQEGSNNTATDKKEDSAKVSESIRSNMSFLNDFNALESLFTNDNWLIVDKKDSSYFYFSRLGDRTINTYHYKIIKGDSAEVMHSPVQIENNEVTWLFNSHKLHILSATKGRAVWAIPGNDSLKYEFIRIDDNHITLTYPDKKTVTLKKMLPFSLFLVRSNYDHSHGTKMAFNTTQLKRK